MLAVIFEVIVHPDHYESYLSIASRLKSDLEKMDGFISVERFQSLTEPTKLLSLSFWRDEESVTKWRNQHEHRMAQAKGRAAIFAGYRLRVAHVMRDYAMDKREQAPADSQSCHS